jgi:putative replication protein
MSRFSVQERLQLLQRAVPAGTQPKFTTPEEWRAWQDEQGRLSSQRVAEQNRQARFQAVLGRSGIQELHRGCTFENYVAKHEGQQNALDKASRYASDFGNGFGGFIFSGGCGTGKNHLAAAIGNALLARNKSVLVVTVPDLMMRFRETYQDGATQTEASLMNDLCNVDLLVLDDIGVQRGNTNEGVILFQIVDRRLANKKPVGMLTNLDANVLNELLGARIMDRMTMDGGMWVNFNWSSYRTQVKS